MRALEKNFGLAVDNLSRYYCARRETLVILLMAIVDAQ